jgi:hypothetical protein
MLDTTKIAKVYSGKIGCMCGCKGKYSYNEGVAREDWQGKVSVRGVKIMAKKVLSDPRVVVEQDFAYVQDSQRGTIKVVYFKETA